MEPMTLFFRFGPLRPSSSILNPESVMRLQSKILTTAVLTALAACGGADSADEEVAPESVGAPVEVPELSNGELLGMDRDRITMTLPWGNGRIARDAGASAASPTLMSLDAVGSSGFDRIVFEFSTDAPYPGYRVEWATEPIEGCTETVGTDGAAVLRVFLEPVMLTDENGRATVPATTRTGLERLGTATRACEIDGTVVFDIQASDATQFRVLEMNAPSRLVVDVRAGAQE